MRNAKYVRNVCGAQLGDPKRSRRAAAAAATAIDRREPYLALQT